ncbi:MAG: hypothetical protein HY298_14730 [Verrucomicrobia bacterium]|nr:hypothetical protein [Verrucomicrobiota bacterium]
MTYQQTPLPKTKKRRGCFFYGCLTVVVIAVVVGIMAVLAVNYVKNLINTYTDTSPMALPKVEMPAAQYEALDKRVTAFKESVDKKTNVSPLVLSGDEINALIANGTNTKQLKDRFYVSIEGDKIKGQLSIPLGETGIPFTKGRYLNGAASFKASLQNGVLIVTADSIVVKNKPLPETFMARLRNENLAKDVYRDPKNAETIRKIESLEVKDNKITIQPRASP